MLLRDIQIILNNFRRLGKVDVLTIDIIRAHQGTYHNAKTSANKSWNSIFGKFLKSNERLLGISEIRKRVSAKDDDGNRTSCSRWAI